MDQSTATSGSAREILEDASLKIIYVLTINVMRL